MIRLNWHATLTRWPVVVALLGQSGGFLVTVLLIPALIHPGNAIPALTFPVLQGIIAAVITVMLPLARWWIPLQMVLPCAVVVGMDARLPSWVWLGAFLMVWLIERNSWGERVPLYLSGYAARQTLMTLLPHAPLRFIDLGCGSGGVLAYLADAYPHGYFEGVESAPLPWLIAKITLMRRKNCQVHWGNFWSLPLAEYDVVYCFLSPAPMARLWLKARAELKPGALLVSNTFIAPNATLPQQILKLADATGPLYVWRM